MDDHYLSSLCLYQGDRSFYDIRMVINRDQNRWQYTVLYMYIYLKHINVCMDIAERNMSVQV